MSLFIETNHPNNGIIGTYKLQYPDKDPLEIFIPNASSFDNGDINTLVTWTSSFQTGGSNNDNNLSFVEIEFKDLYVHPFGYGLKGYYGKNFARVWLFQGIDDQGNITDIEENTSSGSLFCSDDNNNTCSNMDWGFFELKKLPQKVFRKLRWTAVNSSNPASYKHIALSGIEVYGTLSATGERYRYPKIGTCIHTNLNPIIRGFVLLFFICCRK